MIGAALSIVANGAGALASYVVTFKSPLAQNNLRMADSSALSLVLAQDANPLDTSVEIGGAGGVDIHGTLRSDTAIVFGGETVSSTAEVSASFGTLTVPIGTAVVGTHLAGVAVTLGQLTVAGVPANLVKTEKAPKNIYTTKLPEFGLVIARGLLTSRPRDGWSVAAVHKITGEVLRGRVGKVTGGDLNVFVWVGDP